MSANNIGVVYDTTTGQIKRIIVPDNDTQLTGTAFHAAANGESLQIISKLNAGGPNVTLKVLQSYLNSLTGRSPGEQT